MVGMITATRRWFRRNRTNFAIGAGVLGAGYLAGQYVLGKLNEARVRMSEERIAKENLRRRFEQNQEDCTFTVLAILPTATENILDAIPVEQILEELQKHKAERLARSTGSLGPSEIASSFAPSVTDAGEDALKSADGGSLVHASQATLAEGDGGESVTKLEGEAEKKEKKKSKVQLWNEMKIQSITRALTLLYTLTLLTLLTRIQLNLLGRRNYLASVVSLASPQPSSSDQPTKIQLENHDDDNFDHAYGNDFETNRRYLSFSWWLLHRGCLLIADRVREAVESVFGELNPRDELTLRRLGELVLEVRKKVEGETEEQRRRKKWLEFLLPARDMESTVLRESGMEDPDTPPTTSLRRLLDETSDLIDSPSFAHVLTLLLDAAFSHLVDEKIATLVYKLPPQQTDMPEQRIVDITGLEERGEKKTKLANTLAVFTRQANAIGAGEHNEYLSAVEQVAQLEAFAAVVYSSNFEFEVADAEAAAQAPKIDEESRPGTVGSITAPGEASYADIAREEGEEGMTVALPVEESYADIAKEDANATDDLPPKKAGLPRGGNGEEPTLIDVVEGEGKGDPIKLQDNEGEKEEDGKVAAATESVESGFESAWKKAEDEAASKAGSEAA